jgi:D-glycero-D-manno-heptose 1,7-bisphosphate phosphatase
MSLRRAVFLDRDGTLNHQIVRNGKPFPPATLEEFHLFDGVQGGCKRLKAAGFFLAVATNQPDVGRKTQRKEVVEAMHHYLQTNVPEVDAVFTCYHAGADHGESCTCRKPSPGMLSQAAAHFGLDLAQSWMIGDRWRDIDCGKAAGARTVFIDWGYDEKLRAQPDFVAKSFSEAVEIVLAHPFR